MANGENKIEFSCMNFVAVNLNIPQRYSNLMFENKFSYFAISCVRLNLKYEVISLGLFLYRRPEIGIRINGLSLTRTAKTL